MLTDATLALVKSVYSEGGAGEFWHMAQHVRALISEVERYRTPSNVEMFRRGKSNGARETLVQYYSHWLNRDADGNRMFDPEETADKFLMELWVRGFKVVPLEPGDKA